MQQIHQFFVGNTAHKMEVFDELHIGITIVTLLLLLLLFMQRNQLRKLNNQKVIRYLFATILLLNMAIHYISKIAVGTWSWQNDLPFHLCFMTNFAMIYILYSDNKRNLYSIVYFFTLIGPLPAMVWPDLAVTYDSYLFYQFMISHHVMFLASMYCLLVLKYKSSIKSALWAFLIGNGIVVVMNAFNNAFGTNYIMMSGLPEPIYRLYPFTKTLSPIFWLELVGIMAFMIALVPVYFENKGIKEEELQHANHAL